MVDINGIELETGGDIPITESLDARADLELGLAWDFEKRGPKIDLDCSALIFSEAGLLLDAVFYNNLEGCGGALKHSGDETTGKTGGFDETIHIDLDALKQHNVAYVVFVVNAHGEGSMAEATNFVATLTDLSESREVGRCEVGNKSLSEASQHDTGVILGVLYRSNLLKTSFWALRKVEKFCAGRNFEESMSAIRSELAAFVDPATASCYTLSGDKKFDMKKGDFFRIPKELFQKTDEGGDGSDCFVGLGWEAPNGLDLDASCLIMQREKSEHGKYEGSLSCAYVVYYGCVSYGSSKAIKHSGDNLTGEGAGDDERIDIDLDELPESVKELFITVTIYTDSGTFSKVHDAYVRLCSTKTGHEFCRFELRGTSLSTTAVVFARIFRGPMDGDWLIEAIGGGANARTPNTKHLSEACLSGNYVVAKASSAAAGGTRASPPGAGKDPPCCCAIC